MVETQNSQSERNALGRKQEFDRDRVVRAARDVFWSNGYAETSITDLERATGIGVSSLYHTFGNKRGLFDAAVDSYLQEVIAPAIVLLQAPVTDPDALLHCLRGVRGVLSTRSTGPAQNGCLLLNAAATPIGRDPQLHQRLQDYRSNLAAALRRGVDARYPLLLESDRERTTRTLLALWMCALVTTRIDAASAVGSLDAALGLIAALDRETA